MDGICVIRTGEPADRLTAADGVGSSERLALEEQAFRSHEGIVLLERRIHHGPAKRVRAQIVPSLLADGVEWHLRRVRGRLRWEDEELTVDRRRRETVAPARISPWARLRKEGPTTARGLPFQRVRTGLVHLRTGCRETCVVVDDPNPRMFRQRTEAAAVPAEVLRLKM